MTKTPALFLVVNHFGVGGAERRMLNYFKYLHAQGHQHSRLILNRALYNYARQNDLLDADNLAIPVGLNRLLPNNFGLKARALSAFDQMIIHQRLSRMAKHKRPKAVYAIVGGVDYLPLFAQASTIAAFVDPTLEASRSKGWQHLPDTTIIDAASDRIAQALALTQIGQERTIHTAPCTFIDYSRSTVEPKQPLVVFCGRLCKEKQPDLFLQAIPLILEHNPGTSFALMGTGPMEKELQDTANDLGVSRKVKIGFEQEPLSTLAKSSVFCSVQRDDNYHSQALLEAMAAENAIVATDVGLTRTLVDETTGITVSPTAAQVAEAVITLLNDPKRCQKLGRNAAQRAQKEHSIERFDAYITTLIHSLQDNHGG